MDPHRSLIGLSMAVALLMVSATSEATVSVPATAQALAASPITRTQGTLADPSGRAVAGSAQTSEAVRCLKQATLQWDFASNAEVLALLRTAQDDLVAAARQQGGAQRMRTDDLLADLNRAIERASTQLGTLISPSGETFGPQAPNRNDLAQLAAEGEDLERGMPLVHRLLLTVDVGPPDAGALPAHTQIQQTEFALANSDLWSWPPEPQAQWPQVRFRF
jgi:hypothetical protein